MRCPSAHSLLRVCTFDKNEVQRVNWVHSSVVRAADCRSAGPWFKSGCALEVFCTHSSVVRFERSRLVACKYFLRPEWILGLYPAKGGLPDAWSTDAVSRLHTA